MDPFGWDEDDLIDGIEIGAAVITMENTLKAGINLFI